jgi:hypothetical protein
MAKGKQAKPLTAQGVERMKAPTKGQVDISDGGHPGLYLRISYGGRKAWVYLTTYQGKLKRTAIADGLSRDGDRRPALG